MSSGGLRSPKTFENYSGARGHLRIAGDWF